MKRIVIAGNILADIVKEIDTYPGKGMLCNIKTTKQAVGGLVPNTTITLKTLDPSKEIIPVGIIGDDDLGKYILSEFKKRNINIDSIKIDNQQSTSFTDVMSETKGQRTFFHFRGGNSKLSYQDIIKLNLQNVDLFHIGYLLLLDQLDQKDVNYGTQMAHLLFDIQQKGIKTSIDVVSENSNRYKEIVEPSLKYCNYVIINEIEAGKIVDINPRNDDGTLNKENLIQILRRLMENGVKDKVLIHCPELGCSINHLGEITFVNSLCLPSNYIKGSVGAGDAFCAGALYGIMEEKSDQDILKIASCTAAMNLRALDSISGAADLETTMKLESLYERR